MMGMNVSFLLDDRELRDLRRAAKARGLAIATVARTLTLRYFDVKSRERAAVGPKAKGMAKWAPPRVRVRVRGRRA